MNNTITNSNASPATTGQEDKMGRILEVPSGKAVSIRIDPSLSGASVKGWIVAKDRTMAFLAAKEVAALFERSSIGAWIDCPAGEETMCPFEFDVPRGYVYPLAHRQETFEEIRDRLMPIFHPIKFD